MYYNITWFALLIAAQPPGMVLYRAVGRLEADCGNTAEEKRAGKAQVGGK